MKKIQIYLAGPYSNPDPKVREERFYKLTKMAGWIMTQGYTVLSPITHGHPIALVTKLPTDYKYWEKVCESQMNGCEILAVYKLDGWDNSAGVSGELAYADKNHIPIILFGSKHDFKKQIKKMLEFYEEINS